MKKLVLLVGSLLAVSAVASAKEVVPQPKVAPEVQVKEVIKEVPVEKIVYRDRVVEVAKAGANGTFEVSYKVPFYGFGFENGLKATKDGMPSFTSIDRTGELFTKAEVEVAPKHKVRAEAKTKLALIPSKAEGEVVPAALVVPKEMKLGYNYAHSDFVSIDTEFALEGAKKSLKVAPTFDVKEYFFENDYVKAKEISLTPAYKYSWLTIPSVASVHEVSLSAAAKFVGPYETEVGLDLEDFVSAKFYSVNLDKNSVKATEVTGNVGIYAKKDFGLYANGNHNIDLALKGGYKLSDFAWSESAKGSNGTRLNEDKLYLQPALTYTYKINDYSKLYTTLGTEVAGKKNYRVEEPSRAWGFDSSVKAGLKVTF